jgi:hypothetical protein
MASSRMLFLSILRHGVAAHGLVDFGSAAPFNLDMAEDAEEPNLPEAGGFRGKKQFSPDEELHQHGSKGCRRNVVGLTFES